MKMKVPTTFTGRKRWEMEAWRLTRDAFERHGFQVAPLGLNRSLILPQAEPLILSAPSPPTVLMLLCAPDAIAFHKPTQRSYLLELKATYRDTFALRARDFAALLMWQSLLCVVHLPSERVYVCPIDDLPAPERIIVPLTDRPLSRWDEGGFALLRRRFPEVPTMRGTIVSSGSQAPFGIWRLSSLTPFEHFFRR
ncbi:MAG: hypothetical protein ACO2PK_11000 [Armatimonadota bacterium]